MFKQKIIDKYAKSLDETKLKAAYENFKEFYRDFRHSHTWHLSKHCYNI